MKFAPIALLLAATAMAAPAPEAENSLEARTLGFGLCIPLNLSWLTCKKSLLLWGNEYKSCKSGESLLIKVNRLCSFANISFFNRLRQEERLLRLLQEGQGQHVRRLWQMPRRRGLV